ncbi:Uncharacterised protein [Clostridioides difficile]|nr:Uncharacterised protein [Clostridioides difficile]
MLSLFWGFRLTIWNVNLNIYNDISERTVCFRLTIWNVNIGALVTVVTPDTVLD